VWLLLLVTLQGSFVTTTVLDAFPTKATCEVGLKEAVKEHNRQQPATPFLASPVCVYYDTSRGM